MTKTTKPAQWRLCRGCGCDLPKGKGYRLPTLFMLEEGTFRTGAAGDIQGRKLYREVDNLARPGSGVSLHHDHNETTGSYLLTLRSFAHRVCTEECAAGYEVREGLRAAKGKAGVVARRNRKLKRMIQEIQEATELILKS